LKKAELEATFVYFLRERADLNEQKMAKSSENIYDIKKRLLATYSAMSSQPVARRSLGLSTHRLEELRTGMVTKD